jgi:2-polyprenyl-6-methoxyphenol hydroxylase-like FAD-dependent oxidoreductase
MRVVVIGAGVAGLGTALALGRRGHEVTILERDATPLPSDPGEAFHWNRRGAPQVRHSHALLARLRNLLRDDHPDVLQALLDAGATELRFTDTLPDTIDDREPKPGDDDLVALACRRTTFEWVLRRTVLAEPHVQLRDGVVVEGLASDGASPPRITGVRIEGGEVIPADVVVAANGRRSSLRTWLADAGAVEIPEDEEDTGIIYYSRFYEVLPGARTPPQEGPIGADLGYLKFAIFQGDNGTFSVTLAAGNEDDELRAVLDPATFDAAAQLLVPVAPWVQPDVSRPITDVHVMAKLLNRLRRFVVDGEPVALGFFALGDANICTNPLYGRGCSLAMVQAHLLADVLDRHADDLTAAALQFEAATGREIEPWYHAAVNQDRFNRKLASEGEAPSDDPQAFFRSVLKDGLLPATRTDAVVLRAFIRAFNLLEAPEALMQNQDVMARVLAVYQDRDNRPPEPVLGPPRAELLAAIS